VLTALGAMCLLATTATGCGALGADLGAPLTGPKDGQHRGDISPRRVAEPEIEPRAATPGATKAGPTPTVTLSPLPQPRKTFDTPRMPNAPSKTDTELMRIAYQLKTVVWESSGIVDPKTTKARCTKSADEIIQVGRYAFTCDVSLWGSSTEFKVRAKVNRSAVEWSWSAKRLPVSEDKAVHEATRQSFKPARVTCDVTKLELVEVGVERGLTCWVTDVYNKSTPYYGELLPDGALAFRPKS
jgi:hypothetical protein